MSSYLFTSESVSEGHPDKIADQISDAVLDAILAQDQRARVACETMVKTGVAIVAGLAVFGVVFAMNSSIHSYMILAYTEAEDVSLNVGFYYMANAAGRLLGEYTAAGAALKEYVWLDDSLVAILGTHAGTDRHGPAPARSGA